MSKLTIRAIRYGRNCRRANLNNIKDLLLNNYEYEAKGAAYFVMTCCSDDLIMWNMCGMGYTPLWNNNHNTRFMRLGC